MRYTLRLIVSRSDAAFEEHLAQAGVDPEGIRIMKSKARNLIIRVDNVSAPAANIIKQQLLSLGGDAAVHRDAITGRGEKSTVYIIADERRLAILTEKLKNQPFDLPALGTEIERLLRIHHNPPEKIPLPHGEIDLTAGPVIMGVINVTPDSFSDGGRYLDPDKAFERALEMVEEGASIIDIGAESTRPGSKELPQAAEIERVKPVLEKLAGRLPVPISIDTRKADVARLAVVSGASIINDISGLRHDKEMVKVTLETKAALTVMHMKGTPANMQEDPQYTDAVTEIIEWLDTRTGGLVSEGIEREKIIVDPGIGFGKRLQDNLAILNELGDFHNLGFPVMIGYSRKSFIGMLTGREPAERLSGGFAALGKCLESGVQIIRVHDVKETADYCKVWKAIEQRGR